MEVPWQLRAPLPGPRASMAELKHKQQVVLVMGLKPHKLCGAWAQHISPTPRPDHSSVLPSPSKSLSIFFPQQIPSMSMFPLSAFSSL